MAERVIEINVLRDGKLETISRLIRSRRVRRKLKEITSKTGFRKDVRKD